ncbi:IclR family transcriptional regulator [Actinotalea sp. M2MS4P-6]|uniref:IclR family transcriptional regulator n=1 Tax=Actinotalea sp. M2MS4P-6 TaxID=2983762 RepID=UPI0021E4A6DE|nr:IclR family transcriptional regulator [Actinotalea sp. M2MS4P-6]MCV2393099.1 IclR family transcriptional regulator [Actinotalea sp. M2MS4P-6]
MSDDHAAADRGPDAGLPAESELHGHGAGDGRSVQRVAAVLEFVAGRSLGAAPGVVEIARGTGLEKSVVSRLLRTLADAGLLSRDEGSGYRIGARLFAIGVAAHDARLVELGERVVAELADRFGERSELFTRTANRCMTVATAAPDSPLQVTGWVGLTYPLASSAAGRALLLDHDDVAVRRVVEAVGVGGRGPNAPHDSLDVLGRLAADRARGYVLAVEEVDRDLIGIAVPVRGAQGRIIASLVVSGPVDRLRARLGEAAKALLDSATEISTALGAGRRDDAPMEVSR